MDFRYALRSLRRRPALATVAVLSLALGIGANTAIFSLIDALILRPLPVHRPDQLVELLEHYPGEPRHSGVFTPASYQHFRERNHVFSDIVATTAPAATPVRGDGFDGAAISAEQVSGNYFAELGLSPAIGRLLTPDDLARGGDAVLSWTTWRNRFQLDPSVLGKRIVVRDTPATIVGVAPRGLTGLQYGLQTDLWLPQPDSLRCGLVLIGRLRPGVSIEQAHAELAVLNQFTIDEWRQRSRDPVVNQVKLELAPAGAGLNGLRDRFAGPLLSLMSIVALLLLLACANIAGMLLARAAERRREIAIRIALGAGRLRLVRHAFAESLVLSIAGALLGIALAWFGAGTLARVMLSGRRDPNAIPLAIHATPDWRVLLFTAAIAILCAILFGLAPAWSAISMPHTRATETRGGRLFGKSLVAAQVALSLALLSAAGLFLQHLANLERLDLGFRRDHLLLVTLDPARSGYRREQLAQPYRDLLRRLQSLPGVRDATISGVTPTSGAGASRFVNVEGRAERPEDRRYVSLNWIAPRYFSTYGTPLLAGRDFQFDDQNRPRVAIVNQAFVRHYFSDGNAVGRRLTLDGDTRPYEIVGVAGDAKYIDLRETPPRTIYFNMFQESRIFSQFSIRTAGNPARFADAARQLAREIIPVAPVTRITTMDDQVDATIVPERVIAALSGVFGGLGALLAAIGLYGLLAHNVARRVKEIGVRMALGAAPSDITRIVVLESLALVAAGTLIGAPLTLWARRFASLVLPDLPVDNAAPIGIAALMMLAIAALAAARPARRAAAIDPIEALRCE